MIDRDGRWHLDELTGAPENHRQQERERPAGGQAIFEQQRPQVAVAVLPDATDVLEQHFRATLGPAQPLPPQAAQGFGHEDPAQRARLVED
ncbi:hypothetical protein D9M68_942330 [compost metagenome]